MPDARPGRLGVDSKKVFERKRAVLEEGRGLLATPPEERWGPFEVWNAWLDACLTWVNPAADLHRGS